MESSLVLTAGEEIQATLKGEFFAVSTNLLANIIMKVVQFVLFLTGHRREGQLIVTNKRVVLEAKEFTFWCIPCKAAFTTMPYSGLASVEYAFAAMLPCGLCRKYSLTVTPSSGDSFGFVIKGGEAEASSIANAIAMNM